MAGGQSKTTPTATGCTALSIFLSFFLSFFRSCILGKSSMLLTQPTSKTQQQMGKAGRRRFPASKDSTFTKLILSTHDPDDQPVDVHALLVIIEDIVGHAMHGVDHAVSNIQGTQEIAEKSLHKASLADFEGIPEELPPIIQKVSSEIAYKCGSKAEAHETTMSILKKLSNYSWDAKIAIPLAAFATTCGEFWLLIRLCATDQLAKSVALLKQLPDVIENFKALKPRFDSINKLIKTIMDVTKCVAEFRQLPDQYISPENPAMSAAMAQIPTAAYWTIKSIVACAAQMARFVGINYEFGPPADDSWDLSIETHKGDNIYKQLKQQLDLCHQHIDEMRHIEAFDNLVRLFETTQMDNQKILRALTGKDEFFQCNSRRRVNIEIFKRKTMLLLISDLDIPSEEITTLNEIYRESRSSPEFQYDVIWLPVLDKSNPLTEQQQKRFEDLRGMMAWYTIHHPSWLQPAVIRFIKEVWKFSKKPILVALDPSGKMACPNALHMVWIWRNDAYPFSATREEELWRKETWSVELVIDHIEPNVTEWVEKGICICLYGGEDPNWIQTFTTKAKEVAKAAKIQLEMIYVGKSKAKHRLQKLITTIETEKLSHCLKDPSAIWYFWTRLECMLYSKMQHGKDAENDPIMQEVMTILSFDGSDQGWAIFWMGSDTMARGKADNVGKSFEHYKDWEADAANRGFIPALGSYLVLLHTPQHCNRLILPGIEGSIPERVVCAECGNPMEKFIMYRCCDD